MKPPFRADLHCHSTCSDGSLSPADLIKLASQIGLRGLSITDHDTVAAYENLQPHAEQHGIEILTGVEWSSSHRHSGVHILAYGFNPNDPVIIAFSQKHRRRRLDRCQQILDKLASIGKHIDAQAFFHDLKEQGISTPGRPHIGMQLVRLGHVTSVDQAFKLYLAEGKRCYVEGDPISAEETLNTIHAAKGVAILAHPQLLSDPVLIGELLEMNFDGVEAYYARFSGQKEQHWVEVANKRGWIVTGGSDFHGDLRPQIPLGCSWVDEETFRRLISHAKREVA